MVITVIMTPRLEKLHRGPRSKTLTKAQIDCLQNFRVSHGYSYPQLKLAMGSHGKGFKFRVLLRALQGKPIWELNARMIVEWLERFVPGGNSLRQSIPQRDYKSLAAGERPDEENGAAHPPRLRSEAPKPQRTVCEACQGAGCEACQDGYVYADAEGEKT